MSELLNSGLNAIRDNKISGASQLADRGLDLLIQVCLANADSGFASMLASARRAANEIIRVRPSMAPLGSWAIRFVNELASTPQNTSNPSSIACQVYDDLMDEKEGMFEELAQAAQKIVSKQARIATLSYSSTVERILTSLQNNNLKVVVAEARPGFEGRRLALSLMDSGLDVAMVTDAQLPMEIKDVDMVVIGADSIFPDGSAFNKTGSMAAALAARYFQKPFYVATDTYKITPLSSTLQSLVEEQAKIEVWPEYPQVCSNIYFELVPFEFITGYITESGVLTPTTMMELIKKRINGHAGLSRA